MRASGTRASRSTTRTSTAAASGRSGRSRYRQWLTHKLGTWHRPVRHLRLRRLRPLHHLVPGRHRHHRGGRRDPRDRRSEADGRRLTSSLARRAVLRRARRRTQLAADRRLRARTSTSRDGRATSSARATPADTFYVVRHGSVALEIVRPGARRRSRSRRSRPARWSAGRGSSRRTAGTSTRARSTRVRATAFDGACLRGEVRGRPGARLRPDAALRAGADRAPAVDAPPAPRRLWRRRLQLSRAGRRR